MPSHSGSSVQQFLPRWSEAAQVINMLPLAGVVDGRIKLQIDMVKAAGDMYHEGAVGPRVDALVESRWQSAVYLCCRAAVEPILG